MEEMKVVVLAQVVRPERKSGFYVVDLEAGKAWSTPVSTLLDCHGDDGIVRLGSLLYIVGGPPLPDSDDSDTELNDDGHHIHMGTSFSEFSIPHLLSLLKSKEGDADDPFKSKSSGSLTWKGAPAMCYVRYMPCCASLGGKIYALGGSAAKACIGEVFTPECGEWKPLAPPPNDLPLETCCVSYPVIPDEKNERLLVHFRYARALYAYYPANGGRWDCLDPRFRSWKSATALVDGVLYSHHRGTLNCLVAYDVMTNSWLKVVYSARFHWEDCIMKFQNMLHLGDDLLCLANACSVLGEFKFQHTNLNFVKFRVERTSRTEVHVTPGPINRFPLEKYVQGINFRVFLVNNPFPSFF